MGKIKVGVVGFGTIGKRVAEAVIQQEDMELVGVTANSYNFRIALAAGQGISLYSVGDTAEFKENKLSLTGTFEDLIKKADVLVDCSPGKVGKTNKALYEKYKKKAIFQGGEKPDVAECSFVAQCNYKEALGKQFVRVVSCNTTALCRTLTEIEKKFGIVKAHATMVRRGSDPGDIKRGPIDGIVPVLELPSHHGPDVRTVLHDVEVFTTAMSVSTTMMHMHALDITLKKVVTTAEVQAVFRKARRICLVKKSAKITSTPEIMEYARDLNRSRGNMYEIILWEEGIGTYKNDLYYLQAVHQESDVIPENIDCIRAMMGFKDAEKSMNMTDKAMGIGLCRM